MKKQMQIIMSLMSALIVILSCSDALAQRGMGINRKANGGWGRGSDYGRMYNTSTVETLTGTVTTVERITSTRARYCGVHLTVKTENEEICVHLGPAWFIDSLDIAVTRDDSLEVTGSRIIFEGKPALIAAILDKRIKYLCFEMRLVFLSGVVGDVVDERYSLFRVVIDKNKCTQGGACIKICPLESAKGLVYGNKLPQDCFSCARCLTVCPEDAIQYKFTIPAALDRR